MKIASITVYCNEEFRLKDWIGYYTEYKDELYRHIIVNNGNEEDTSKLKSAFPESIVLFSPGKALTSAYNLALKLVLDDKEIDAVMLICNDIKLQKGDTTLLYNFLYSNDRFGMVAPILLKKDSRIIELYGANIDPHNLFFRHLHSGKSLDSSLSDVQFSDSLPGGMNMSRSSFYNKVGLQDESLFMYSDEVDMGIRARKSGFIMASTKNVKAWHQHINPNNVVARSPLAGFLCGRNEIFIARKYYGFKIVFGTIWFRIKEATKINLGAWLKWKTHGEKLYSWYYLLGVLAGIFNIKKIPFTNK